jgi:hypothetical protein
VSTHIGVTAQEIGTALPAGSWVTTTSPNTMNVPLSINNTVSHQGGPFGTTGKTVYGNFVNSVDLKENEAFNTDVQTLSDLWLAKWGNEWVDLSDLQEDKFWTVACERLKQLGMIEQHYLTDRAMHVCRRPT